MKKVWETPKILVQEFEANEYVAACGDTEYGMYKFVCDAGNMGTNYGIKDASGNWATINGKRFNQWNWYFTPCNATHESPTDEVYLKGYHLDNRYTSQDENIEVIIWTDNGIDVHCTTNLNQNSWEVTKS